MDDTNYLTPREGALALVATSMKKARLKFDTLVINSIVGGILFSAGGMLFYVVSANPELQKANPGIVHTLQGLVYPIGLFYVVIMGVELFNSNVLFFSMGLLRGAVGIFDLLISWSVSWLFNLGANIFVSYLFTYIGGFMSNDIYKETTLLILKEKNEYGFIRTFIGSIACNWFVSLAIFLQIMCKPLHVKFLMMILPVFTFVAVGFSHTVADMFLCPMALFNDTSEVSVADYIWRILIPETLGNCIGGFAFALLIPYYQHLYVVERDSVEVGLPKYEAKDEQPELNMDSRVVRLKPKNETDSLTDSIDERIEKVLNKILLKMDERSNNSQMKNNQKKSALPNEEKGSPLEDANDEEEQISNYSASIISSINTAENRAVNQNLVRKSLSKKKLNNFRSPPGVFPVMGMGEPLNREKTIASGFSAKSDYDNKDVLDVKSVLSRFTTTGKISDVDDENDDENELQEYTQEGGKNPRDRYLGTKLLRKITTRPKIESPNIGGDLERGLTRALTSFREASANRKKPFLNALEEQNISNKELRAANDVTGNDYDMNELREWTENMKKIQKDKEDDKSKIDAPNVKKPSEAHKKNS